MRKKVDLGIMVEGGIFAMAVFSVIVVIMLANLATVGMGIVGELEKLNEPKPRYYCPQKYEGPIYL